MPPLAYWTCSLGWTPLEPPSVYPTSKAYSEVLIIVSNGNVLGLLQLLFVLSDQRGVNVFKKRCFPVHLGLDHATQYVRLAAPHCAVPQTGLTAHSRDTTNM